jgi:hypothetical protein
VAIWSRNRQEDAELSSYAEWVKEIREPNMDQTGIRRLESEIRALRNDILTAFGQRYVRPRNARITDLRRKIDTLKGMVFAWLYASGKWDKVPALSEVTDEINDLAMLWLSVDLTKMFDTAYPKKAPRDVLWRNH